jgi:hypothetical protein
MGNIDREIISAALETIRQDEEKKRHERRMEEIREKILTELLTCQDLDAMIRKLPIPYKKYEIKDGKLCEVTDYEEFKNNITDANGKVVKKLLKFELFCMF